MILTDYLIQGVRDGLLLGFAFYFASWGLLVGLRLLKIKN